MMLSKLRCVFEKFTVEIELDEEWPENASVQVHIDASSINTRDTQGDVHLQSPDFLNVAEYPALIFRSKRVERTGESTANIHGDLTIRDVTKPVVLDAVYLGAAKSLYGASAQGFEAEAKVDREDWCSTWNVALETGGLLVGKEIQLHIETEFIQE